MKWLLALLLSVMSGAALAETTGAVNPGSVPAQPSANDDVPPGRNRPPCRQSPPLQKRNPLLWRQGPPLSRRSPPRWSRSPRPWSRSPPQDNRKAWRQRTANRRINRLKHCRSALSTSRTSAPCAQTTARAIGPTIQHPEPTGATTDGAVSADRFAVSRQRVRCEHDPSGSGGHRWYAPASPSRAF